MAASAAIWLLQALIHVIDPGASLLESYLAWSPAHWTQRPWTLWTASLVHLNGAHLLANLLALGALALLGLFTQAGRAAVLALFAAWPLGTLSLVYWPEVTGYAGLSGLIHASAAVLWAWVSVHGTARPLSFVLFTGLALKLLSEHAWTQPVAFSLDWGFNVVYAAHLSGALSGALTGWIAALATYRGSSSPGPWSNSH